MTNHLIFLIFILTIISFFSTAFGSAIIDYLNFFVEGQKYNFSVAELHLLWKVAKASKIRNKTRLFWSIQALQETIAVLSNRINLTQDAEEKEKLTDLLSKLYGFRTKVELETLQKKRGVQSTDRINIGQVCVLVFPNFGQFYATLIENNIAGLKFRSIGELPKAFNFKFTGSMNVYFWRQGDAGYLFTTDIKDISQSNAGTVFFTSHSKNIIRTQKRKSVRAKANFPALLFPQHPETPANVMPEVINGVKCVIKDISEDGALVLVKGKCVKGMRAKLQFEIAGKEIVMFVKAIRFTYSTSQKMSKIHFHCEKVREDSKNDILSYVYEIGERSTAAADIFDDALSSSLASEL